MLKTMPQSYRKLHVALECKTSAVCDVKRSPEEINESIYRTAPIHPWLRVTFRPQRHILWGAFVSIKNSFSCLLLLFASIACHLAGQDTNKVFSRSLCYISVLQLVNYLVFLKSIPNTAWAVKDCIAKTSACFFDPYQGNWVNKDLYTNLDLGEMKEEIMHQGKLYFQLRQIEKGVELSNLIGIKHYETLGVSYIATREEIDEAYTQLRRMYSSQSNTYRLKQISDAYAIIGDSEKRALYDAGGDGAVYTRGSNPLFLGFCNPYSSAHRVDLRDFIGGPLITAWLTGDPLFGHLQLRNLDRIQISAGEFEMLMFLRAGNLCDSLYHRVLKHYFLLTETEYQKRALTFIEQYIITSPFGVYMASILGDVYLACADDILSSKRWISAAKVMIGKRMLKFVYRLHNQYLAYQRNDQHMMGCNTISAQLDALEVDIHFVSRLAINRLMAQISDRVVQKQLGNALKIFGKVMSLCGKKWDDTGKQDLQVLYSQMNEQASRWRSVDVSKTSFL